MTKEFQKAEVIAMITVRELQEAMNGLDPDTVVLLDNGSGWYSYTRFVEQPNENFAGLTLFAGESFDARDDVWVN